jgi:hypothetical protein
MNASNAKFPLYAWAGLFLMGISWFFNWRLDGLRTHYLFFPLWLGYCLTVDGLVLRRSGTSLLHRSWKRYIGLFVISAPAWWLFELLNLRAQNWFYLGRESFTNLSYSAFSTLSFSTVMPAVFGTAELASTFGFIRRAKPFLRVPTQNRHILAYLLIGIAMLALVLLFPLYFYPLLWASVYFLIEPINVRLGNRSLLDFVKTGDWRPVWSLWLGCLACGFFWEMWNYFSFPKWIYHTPHVQFAHIFEMPLLGYSGYLPFSMELFALYNLATFIIERKKNSYLFFGQ